MERTAHLLNRSAGIALGKVSVIRQLAIGVELKNICNYSATKSRRHKETQRTRTGFNYP